MKHMRTVPLLQSQLGIYLQCRRLRGTAYNQHWLYTLDDAVDPDRLATAIDRVMAFYPSLNTRLRKQDGKPVQYIPDKILTASRWKTCRRMSGNGKRRSWSASPWNCLTAD